MPYNPRLMATSRHSDLSLKYVLSVPSGRKDDAEIPLVIVMHGRGADANDLADIASALDVDGIRFVFPNAPKPFDFSNIKNAEIKGTNSILCGLITIESARSKPSVTHLHSGNKPSPPP